MSDSKLIIRICCATLFFIGCVLLYDFYENKYLPPQRGFYIISAIDAEQFTSPRDTLHKKNETRNLLQKIKTQLFSEGDQAPLSENLLNSIPEDQLATCQAFSEKESATQKNDYYYLDSENNQLHRFRRNVENISSFQTDPDDNKFLVFPNGNVNFKRESEASFSIYYTLWVKACELGSKKNVTCIKVEENDPRLLALKGAQKEERADDLAYFASLKKKVLPIISPNINSVTIGRGSVSLYAPIGSTLLSSTFKLPSALEENYVPTHDEEWYTLVTNNISVAGIHAFSTDGSAFDYNTLMMKRIPPEHILFQNQNGIIYYHTVYKCIAISHYAFDAKKNKHIIADAYLKITDTTWKTAQSIFATFRTLDPKIRVNLTTLDQKELFKRLIPSSEKEFLKAVGEGDIRSNDYKFFTKKYIRSLLLPGVLLKKYPKLVRRSPIAMFHAADVEVFKGDRLNEVNAPESNSGLWKVVYENNSPNRQILLYQNMPPRSLRLSMCIGITT